MNQIPKSNALSFALRYLAAGLSIIPIRADGTKAAAIKWQPYQQRRAQESEVRAWFNHHQYGIAVIGGAVSGRLEHLDFDTDAAVLFPAWCGLVEAEAPGLIDRLSIRTTPRDPPGYHVSYRCPAAEIPGNTKLAEKIEAGKRVGLIETRGEGGYVIVPGSPLQCHNSGRPYRHARGPALEEVGSINPTEREILWRCAQSFDHAEPEEQRAAVPSTNGTGHKKQSPGDDFNEHGPEWAEILAGWTRLREADGKAYWRRPGKHGEGWSATTGCRSRNGRELFCVFSSNAEPFPGPGGTRACSVHDKFGAYCLIHHYGDFAAAAKELARKGFGEKRETRIKATPEEEPAKRPQHAWEIIRDYFRERYNPGFKLGDSIHSELEQRDVRRVEACAVLPPDLIDGLTFAIDAPRHQDGTPKGREAMPALFRKWVGTGWAGLIAELPDEDSAALPDDASAADEFRRLVREALFSQIVLGSVIRGKSDEHEVVQTERRSLIDWCERLAKPGPWRDIRSYRCWVKARTAEDGELILAIAIRHELFAQLKADRRLADMGPKRFARRVKKYGVGFTSETDRPHGWNAIHLDQNFVNELRSGVPDEICASSESATAPSEEAQVSKDDKSTQGDAWKNDS